LGNVGSSKSRLGCFAKIPEIEFPPVDFAVQSTHPDPDRACQIPALANRLPIRLRRRFFFLPLAVCFVCCNNNNDNNDNSDNSNNKLGIDSTSTPTRSRLLSALGIHHPDGSLTDRQRRDPRHRRRPPMPRHS
jgi:hypothetical protein